MIVCPKPYNVVFVAVPKTGTRSIYYVLKEKFDGKLQGEHRKVIPLPLTSYFSFITVRNPYDRICSTYWAVCVRPDKNPDRYGWKKKFKEKGWANNLQSFVKLIYLQRKPGNQMAKAHTLPQITWHQKNKIDRIIRFENLQEDFNKLPFVKKSILLPKRNHTTEKIDGHANYKPRPSWEEMITPDIGKMVNDIYQKDFEKFGYTMLNF